MVPSWIDNDFIQTAIKSADGNEAAVVDSITVQSAVPAGENYGSDLYRVNARLQGIPEEQSLIVKIVPKELKDTFKRFEIFESEIGMFCKLLPKMYSFLDNKLKRNYHRFSAKCLHSGKEPEIFIVLEDLTSIGFSTAPRREGLDWTHCRLVIQSIARFHALSLALLQDDPLCLQDYKTSFFSRDEDTIRAYIKAAVEFFVEELKKWPEIYSKYGPKMLSSSETLVKRLLTDTNYREGKYNVLLHGDLWSNNIMFKYKDGNPIALCFVDFQMSSLGSPALDLQYFLYTSPSEDVYLQRQDELIDEYHSSLLRCLDLLDCSQFHITRNELQEHLDQYYFYGYYAALTILPIVLADPTVAQEVKNNMEDLGKGGGATSVVYKNESYMNYMMKLLPVFDEKGCFN